MFAAFKEECNPSSEKSQGTNFWDSYPLEDRRKKSRHNSSSALMCVVVARFAPLEPQNPIKEEKKLTPITRFLVQETQGITIDMIWSTNCHAANWAFSTSEEYCEDRGSERVLRISFLTPNEKRRGARGWKQALFEPRVTMIGSIKPHLVHCRNQTSSKTWYRWRIVNSRNVVELRL